MKLQGRNPINLGSCLLLSSLLIIISCNKKKSEDPPAPVQQTPVVEVTIAGKTEPKAEPKSETQTVGNPNPPGTTTGTTTPPGTTPTQPLSGSGSAAPAAAIARPESPANTPLINVPLTMDDVRELIGGLDFQLHLIPAFTYNQLELKATNCANKYLSGITFQGTIQGFSLTNSEDFKACMQNNPPIVGAGGKQEYSISYSFKAACTGTDFTIYNAKTLTDPIFVKSFCKDSTQGSILFNITLETKEYSNNILTRVHKRIKAFQSRDGAECTFTQAAGIRSYGPCMWVDKTDGKDSNLHFVNVIFNDVKGGFSGDGLSYTAGNMDLVVNQWQGKVNFTPETAQKTDWNLIDSKDAAQKTQGQFIFLPVDGTQGQNGAPVQQQQPQQKLPNQGLLKSETLNSVALLNCPAEISAKNALDGGSNIVIRRSLQLDQEAYVSGYIVNSSINKDAFAARISKAVPKIIWCRIYASSSADEEGGFISMANGALYAAFSSDGDGGVASFQVPQDAWQTRAGSGGGKKTTWISHLDAATGDIIHATWFSARNNPANNETVDWSAAQFRNDGPAQSLEVDSIAEAGQGQIRIAGHTWGYGPGCKNYATDANRNLTVLMSSDLKNLINAEDCPLVQ